MCFSASASFSASAILLGIGILSIKNTETRNQKKLASIPLIFSAQQCIEGFAWISIADASQMEWAKLFSYGFLIIAQILWPILIPYSILAIEKVPRRKKMLLMLWILGIIHGIYFGYGLIYFPVTANISESHIMYKMGFPPANHWYGGLLYILATVLPPFLSSIKKMYLIGLIVLIAYIISHIFFTNYVISIWCYFATTISIVIFMISLKFKKDLNLHSGLN
jgi:hypothetical protein